MLPYLVVFVVGLFVFGTKRTNDFSELIVRAAFIGLVAHIMGL